MPLVFYSFNSNWFIRLCRCNDCCDNSLLVITLSCTAELLDCTTCSIKSTFLVISRRVSFWFCEASFILLADSEISFAPSTTAESDFAVSSAIPVPFFTADNEWLISSVVWFTDSALLKASSLISDATTANPLPDKPAFT